MTNSKLYLAPRKCPDARILHHFVISFQNPRLKGRSLHFLPVQKKIPSIQNLNETTALIRHNTKSYDFNKGRQLIINRTIQKVMILIKGDNSSLLRHNRMQGIVASICPPPFFISRAVW